MLSFAVELERPFGGDPAFSRRRMDQTVKGSENHGRDETIAEICPGQLPRITPEKSKSEQKGREDLPCWDGKEEAEERTDGNHGWIQY
jgi:hypothetical protein